MSGSDIVGTRIGLAVATPPGGARATRPDSIFTMTCQNKTKKNVEINMLSFRSILAAMEDHT